MDVCLTVRNFNHPAAEVIEALVLEAELNTTLIANQLTHFNLVVSALINICC